MLKDKSYDENKCGTVFSYKENILDKRTLSKVKAWLENQNYKDGFCLDGKEIPRKQLWFQEDNKYFCEQWKYRYDRWNSEDYSDFLNSVQKIIQNKTDKILEDMPSVNKPKINSCLVNKYRNGKDTIKPHSDCPQSFGEYPTIVNFSIGETREIVIKNKRSKEKITFELKENSLFIMAGDSQKNYTHEIPEADTEFTRYSMTFREYIN